MQHGCLQVGFADSLCFVAWKAFSKNSRTLKASWWKVIKTLLMYGIVQVSLFLLTGRTEIVNAQAARAGEKDWYLTI